MQLARVIGPVVSTVKARALSGQSLLMIQPVTPHGEPQGLQLVAVNTVQAGEGDLVLVVGGREAAIALPDTFNPADYAIVGIVDHLP